MDALARSSSLLQAVKYANVASMAILLYDYFLTVGMEVLRNRLFAMRLAKTNQIEVVWKAQWGIGKVLFLFARYPTFIDVPMMLYYCLTPNLSDVICHRLYSASSWMTVFGIGIAEAILVMRTYALWENKRTLLVSLMILYTVIYLSVIVILVFFLRSLRYGAPPLPVVKGCYPVSGSNILFADFALLMVFETVVVILTLWVGIQRYRHSRNPLISILYRDGIFYFVALFFISLGNVLVLVAGPPELLDLLDTFQRVMHSVLSTRIILHVRSIAESRVYVFSSSQSLSEIQFEISDAPNRSGHVRSPTILNLERKPPSRGTSPMGILGFKDSGHLGVDLP